MFARARTRMPWLRSGTSRIRGGRELSHHHSHESGRDADVAFFLSDNRGHAWLQNEYVRIDANGRAPTHGGVLFDDARNWAFVRALVTSAAARGVMSIFVARWLRERLLAYGKRRSASRTSWLTRRR